MKIGIIGGSGLDDPRLLQDCKEIELETPHGKPSSKITQGKMSGRRSLHSQDTEKNMKFLQHK